MDCKIKHESIARAEVKGAFTKTDARYEELYLKKARGVYSPFSKKKMTKFIDDCFDTNKDFLIHSRKIMRKNSWHFFAEMVTIETVLKEMDGIGNVSRLFIDAWDTRRFIKGDNGHLPFESNFYFHEHFLIRLVQRLGWRGFSQMGEDIYPLITWIAKRNKPSTWYSRDSHFVFKDFVLVTTFLPKNEGLVFKTILLNEFFDENQKAFYQQALISIKDSNSSVACLDATTGILKLIELSDEVDILLLANKSFWIYPAKGYKSG